MWAQRPGLIFLTICLEDVKDPQIKVEPDKLYFKGVGGTEKKPHEVTVNFFKEIDPEVSFKNVPIVRKSRRPNVILQKKLRGVV